MDFRQLSERARGQLAEVTGLKPESIIGAFQDEQGWHVTLEMLEMSRIPTATDVLGDYEVLLDARGDMMKFVRKRTRLRAEPTNHGE